MTEPEHVITPAMEAAREVFLEELEKVRENPPVETGPLTIRPRRKSGLLRPLQTIDQREQDEKNRIASAHYNHTPGLRHTLKFDNITYDVDRNGAWHRVTPRLCAKHHNMKNHSVARRARRGVV
jgi:hypothetical protein